MSVCQQCVIDDSKNQINKIILKKFPGYYDKHNHLIKLMQISRNYFYIFSQSFISMKFSLVSIVFYSICFISRKYIWIYIDVVIFYRMSEADFQRLSQTITSTLGKINQNGELFLFFFEEKSFVHQTITIFLVSSIGHPTVGTIRIFWSQVVSRTNGCSTAILIETHVVWKFQALTYTIKNKNFQSHKFTSFFFSEINCARKRKNFSRIPKKI